MKYRTIVADPPWPFEWTGGGAYRANGRGERHLNHKFKKGLAYQTMSIAAIAALPVQASPGPYLELFARRQRLGWDTWGNECFRSVELEA